MEKKHMNLDKSKTNQSYIRAKEKVELIRKFYKHLVVYVLVNIIISTYKMIDYMDGGYTFDEAFFQLDIFIVWMIWGVFVVLQAVRVFGSNVFLGKDWEDKKIQEMMNNKN